ncbi:hypothetical protein V1477_010833 [Vespula maculifrons]|uniref:Uncharacterized protein n=1 Tax=Vespula maculifrons TaxID=7453 RepID=A0ABD2C362_VESMC
MRDASPPILLPFPSHPLHPPHPPRLPPSPSPATPPPPPSPLTLSESLILTIVRATATPTNPEERLRRLLTIRVSSYRPEDILMRNVDGLGHSRAYSKEDSSRRSKDLTGLHGRVIYNFHSRSKPQPPIPFYMQTSADVGTWFRAKISDLPWELSWYRRKSITYERTSCRPNIINDSVSKRCTAGEDESGTTDKASSRVNDSLIVSDSTAVNAQLKRR